MSNLRGRMLEREFCDISRELGGDVEGVERGRAYLAAAHGSDADDFPWSLTPKIYDEAEVALLADAAEAFGRILEKVCAAYAKDTEFRKLFGLSPELEELVRMPTGYARYLPMVRLDAFVDDATGNVCFMGVASDSPEGMTATVDVTRSVQQSESYRRFQARHRQVKTFDLGEEAFRALRDTYRSWANSDAGVHHPDHPVVGIVDYPEDAVSEEYADLIQRMADEGVYARFVDIRGLRVEDCADGLRRLVDDEGPIACVYRRAQVTDMLYKPCDGAKALAEAARTGLACVVNGFNAWPVTSVELFSILRSEAAESVLDAQELAFVRAHTPASYELSRGCDLKSYIAEKDRWLVRPNGTYSVRDNVSGSDCDDADDWWRVLLAACDEGALIQEVSAVPSMDVYVCGKGAEGASEPVSAGVMTGLYLFNGKFGGVWARAGVKDGRGQKARKYNMGTLVVCG